MRKRTLAALGTVAAWVLWWQWPSQVAPLDASIDPASRSANTAATAQANGDHRPAAPPDDRTRREAVATAGTAPGAGEWVVRLVGIDPVMPWTAPLRFVFQDRAQLQATVDAHGECRFMPPALARDPGTQNLQLFANDDHYCLEHSYLFMASLQETGTAEFAVYPIARLRGRVLGPDGRGLVARVSAFRCDASGPRTPLLAHTTSEPDGGYVLRVPPAVPLLVLAEAMAVAAPSLLGPTPQPMPLFDFGGAPSLDGISATDDRPARTDLLPATARCEGTLATPRTLPDLRLGATAALDGRVTLADGRALAGIDVHAQPAWATAAAWRHDQHWSPTDGLMSGATARTDERGAFTLRLAPGVPFRVRAAAADLLLLAGEPGVIASAPGFVELAVPGDLVTLRVVADGQPVARATLDIANGPAPAEGPGRRRLTLGPSTVRLRARTDLRASPWLDLPPDARPAVATLDLVAVELAEVQLRLHSSPTVRDAEMTWQDVASGAVLSTKVQRGPGDVPFVVRVPPGRYHVSLSEQDGIPGGPYLLPLQLDLDVPPAGLEVTHAAAFGGQLWVDVRAANGTRPEGTFTLRDATGRDVTPATRLFAGAHLREAAPGVLQGGNINWIGSILPPGSYDLVLDVLGCDRSQQTVILTAGSTTIVRLRPR